MPPATVNNHESMTNIHGGELLPDSIILVARHASRFRSPLFAAAPFFLERRTNLKIRQVTGITASKLVPLNQVESDEFVVAMCLDFDLSALKDLTNVNTLKIGLDNVGVTDAGVEEFCKENCTGGDFYDEILCRHYLTMLDQMRKRPHKLRGFTLLMTINSMGWTEQICNKVVEYGIPLGIDECENLVDSVMQIEDGGPRVAEQIKELQIRFANLKSKIQKRKEDIKALLERWRSKLRGCFDRMEGVFNKNIQSVNDKIRKHEKDEEEILMARLTQLIKYERQKALKSREGGVAQGQRYPLRRT